MRKLALFLLLFCSVVLSPSCRSNKPPEGDYSCILRYYSENGTPLRYETGFKILESNKTSLEIRTNLRYSLSKDGNSISGSFGGSTVWTPGGTWRHDPIRINGVWKKENGVYVIIGNFTSTIHYAYMDSDDIFQQGSSEKSGTFEIVPKE